MNDVPPEVWTTGHAMNLASSLTARSRTRAVNPVTDQQDGAVRRSDQLRCFSHLALTGGLSTSR